MFICQDQLTSYATKRFVAIFLAPMCVIFLNKLKECFTFMVLLKEDECGEHKEL